MSIPQPFLDKMQALLGAEFAPFVASYERPFHVGLRVNTLKISAEDFSRKRPFTLEAVGDYEPAGFRVLDANSQPGKHPYHAAGLYYLQEPSAMAVAALLRPWPGDLVLDLAAAPGGKATHLAALLQGEGLLVANDVHHGRAQILSENLERWGARNIMVTNNQPEQLARAFGPLFDKVLLDAPCSGEGMFRKQGGFEWSADMVAACSRRQSGILETAVSLIRPGGVLAYATCTFSPEEDEQVIARFLNEHPAFSLIAPPAYTGFQSGQPAWADGSPDLARAVRLWPHHFPGEGHFIALLQKHEDNLPQRRGERREKPISSAQSPLSTLQLKLWRRFAHEHLRLEFDEQRLRVINGRYLILLPAIQLPTQGLRLLRHGLDLGELRANHFLPAHALALSLQPADVHAHLDFPPDAPEIHQYLTGHLLDSEQCSGNSEQFSVYSGKWVLITTDDYPLGWGKHSGGQIKNHYPRALRLNA